MEHRARRFQLMLASSFFNDRTYPNFNQLLEQLGVERQPTEMSGVHNTTTRFEYNGHSINSLFALGRIFCSKPQFWSLVSDILKFNKLCKAQFESNNSRQMSPLATSCAKSISTF
ncbi:hypothetical protein O9993_09470 [Vibrio lentus]|nr:hypothetical protein [Vibrio lentus]